MTNEIGYTRRHASGIEIQRDPRGGSVLSGRHGRLLERALRADEPGRPGAAGAPGLRSRQIPRGNVLHRRSDSGFICFCLFGSTK